MSAKITSTKNRSKKKRANFQIDDKRTMIQLLKDFEEYFENTTDDEVTVSDALLTTGFSDMKHLKEKCEERPVFSLAYNYFITSLTAVYERRIRDGIGSVQGNIFILRSLGFEDGSEVKMDSDEQLAGKRSWVAGGQKAKEKRDQEVEELKKEME